MARRSDTTSVAAVDGAEFRSEDATPPADQWLHNPCSYASFAVHDFKGSDPAPRFGGGNEGRFL